MPLKIAGLHGGAVLQPAILCQESFSSFGTVIQNPSPSLVPSLRINTLPPNAVQANQGSAIKYQDVSIMRDLYGTAPSRCPGTAVMNMFVCAPRALSPRQENNIEGHFPIEILERHPYTSQTFIPLGTSAAEASQARYLVIVAPSLPPLTGDEHLPVPAPIMNTRPLPGRGLPDLKRIRAFIANGSQAVTYDAGTWHAPMVVLGTKPVDFVVVQFANGVGIEDCQEVGIDAGERGRLLVAVPRIGHPQTKGLWRL